MTVASAKSGRVSVSKRARARCMHPDCSRKLTWDAGQGRPRLFCGQPHRDAYRLERKQLLTQLAAASDAPSTSVQRADEPRLRWLLARYPDLT